MRDHYGFIHVLVWRYSLDKLYDWDALEEFFFLEHFFQLGVTALDLRFLTRYHTHFRV